MENSEEILAVLKAVDDSLSGRGKAFRVFDLCFTNERLVIIKPKRISWIIKWLGLETRKRRKQDPLRDLTVDELLEKDKSSYAINYYDLDWVCLNTSFFGSNLNIRGRKFWKIIKLNKEQFKQLSRILPRIAALKGKLEINK